MVKDSPSNKKENIYNLTRENLNAWAKSTDISSFYVEKIWQNLYRKKRKSFLNMKDLREDIIAKLSESFTFPNIFVKTLQKSTDGTVKFLFQLEDGALIESVLMKHSFGLSICVTSQVGCNIGCNFCASGMKAKKRNLNAYEILSQIMMANEYLLKEEMEDKKNRLVITHIVLMGIGEPFDNYHNLMTFLRIVNDDKGLAFGYKHITVSTSGIVPRILDFAKQDIRANLAISLHAPNNALRSKLMKINQVYPLELLFDALKTYIEITNKRVTFEYILIKDFNDSLKEAEELWRLLEPIKKYAYVNLIPYNPVFEVEYERSRDEDIKVFFNFLTKKKIMCVLRKEHGRDIDAACGQLRSKYIE